MAFGMAPPSDDRARQRRRTTHAKTKGGFRPSFSTTITTTRRRRTKPSAAERFTGTPINAGPGPRQQTVGPGHTTTTKHSTQANDTQRPAQARTPHTDTTNTRPTHNQDHNQPPPGQVSAQTVLGHPPPDLDRQDRTIAAHRFREAKNLTSGRQRWCIPAGGVSGLLGRSAGAMRKATVSALGISPTLALTAA